MSFAATVIFQAYPCCSICLISLLIDEQYSIVRPGYLLNVIMNMNGLKFLLSILLSIYPKLELLAHTMIFGFNSFRFIFVLCV